MSLEARFALQDGHRHAAHLALRVVTAASAAEHVRVVFRVNSVVAADGGRHVVGGRKTTGEHCARPSRDSTTAANVSTSIKDNIAAASNVYQLSYLFLHTIAAYLGVCVMGSTRVATFRITIALRHSVVAAHFVCCIENDAPTAPSVCRTFR